MDEHTLNDLLECSVCLERLDTTSKVLPCQHTFCRKCLEVIVSSQSVLRCPECRVLVDIKIEDLPPNVLLMRILEGMKNASSQASQNNQQILNISLSNNLINVSTNNQPDQPAALQTNSSQETDVSVNNVDNEAVNNLASREEQRRTAQNNQENHPRTDQHQQQQQQQQPHIYRRMENRPMNLMRQPLQNTAIQQNTNNKQTPPNIASSLSTPHAKALYDFESKEPGDLNFKKGDKIALLRRIDINWFVGECNGREGVFPINYVQVLVPLPQPQCKALYDFRMGPNEEEGCLTFKKGAIINVLRRVDPNWAEGRIGDTIGIFPIAFVEMNALAKYVIDVKSMFSAKRVVPATPNDQNTKHNGFSSDSSSTLTTSPNSSATSNTSSNSSTAPNSPNNQLPVPVPVSVPVSVPASVPVPVSNTITFNENRFSLNASGTSNGGNVVSSNQSSQNSNRHSKEIAMPPNVVKSKQTAQKYPSKSSQSESSTRNNHSSKGSTVKSSSSSNQRSAHNLTSASSIPSNTFIALYPYKPQKSDELELKKGSIYYVKERCQDGWFRGTNRAQNKSGVFPGNYVAPIRNGGSNGQNENAGAVHAGNAGNASNHQNRSHGNSGSQTNSFAPELPPRSSGSSTSVWSKPIGQHVEAFFGRSQSSLIKRITNIKRSKSPVNQLTPSYSMDNPVFEDNTIGCASNVSTSSSSTTTTASNTKRNAIHLSHPVHVRSGSCPSQLLQSLPVEINLSSMSNTSGIVTKADVFGSQRLKAHRERPTLQAMRQSMEANGGGGGRSKSSVEPSSSSSSSYHRKSQSLDAATISAQIANSSNDANGISKRKSYTHNEKFKCIVSYPPNSEFELELQVGDIVYVHKKRDNGWYKGIHARTGKVGLFPSSFVEPDI